MVIGSANHAYDFLITAKEQCTATVLLDSSLMSQSGSRKDEPVGAWFSEPPNKELGTPKNVFLMLNLWQIF